MLEVSGLNVSYGNIAALRGVSLSVHAGETIAVIGANGAGKSTLLATIAGLVPIKSGSINFEGTPIAGTSPEALARRGIALVPERRDIFATLTVEENLRLGATVRSDRSTIAIDIRRMYEMFPALERFLHDSAGQLSGGQQQQLALARALMSQPRLLMLDEPSLGLAPVIVDQLFEVIADLKADGTTILLVEQNATRAVSIAERVYALRTGRVEFERSGKELATTADFEAVYLGDL